MARLMLLKYTSLVWLKDFPCWKSFCGYREEYVNNGMNRRKFLLFIELIVIDKGGGVWM